MSRTKGVSCIFIATWMLFISGCQHPVPVPIAVRTYRMGFQNSAPRYDDINFVLQALNIWVEHADAAMITTEVPWDSLLNDVDPVDYVLHNYTGLVDFYRQKNFKLWVYIDPANGLNRASDANALVALNKSIADADMQQVYRRFVVVMDSLLKPEHLGLALETNLIRFASSSVIYQGVVQAAHDAAADIRAVNTTVKLSVSVQADVAWGSGSGTYVGIAQDFIDFPFIEELGISSYPYFDYASPDDMPDNYYARLVEGKSMPVFVSEGGWTSETFDGPSGTITSSPEKQALYISRQLQLLTEARAIAVFQLTFTDLDLDPFPPNVDQSIRYFEFLGMVDVDLQSRPAWELWKEHFGIRLLQ